MADEDLGAANEASAFFGKARQASEVRDFDAAIEAFMKGLRLAPETVDAHIELRLVALRRREAGGPPPSESELAQFKQGKTALDVMLGAEYLLAKDPTHLPYAERLETVRQGQRILV